jgi:hypothetical protein
MSVVKSLAVVPLVVFALSFPASAQETQGEPPRHYFTGLGGAAFDLEFEQPSFTFAVEYGERLHRDVQAYANLSYIENLMSDRMDANLVAAGATLTALDGVLWEFAGRDRGLAFTVGGKFLMPINSRLRPYVGAGFGLLNLKRRITERDLGDVTDEYFLLGDLGVPSENLNDGRMRFGESAVTKPLGEVMLGVGGALGRAYVDVAYRYRHGFHSFEPVKFSQVTFGIGAAWR